MSNLLKETIELLKENGKSESDILWVGTDKYWFPWDEFKKLADTEYDDSYGSAQVAQNLIVVGNNFWLERHEYDGSEWWELKSMPHKPKNKVSPNALLVDQSKEDVSCGREDFESLNGLEQSNERA